MKKETKKTKGPAKSAKRKVAIKDLKAKDAGSVKGGVLTSPLHKVESSELKINPIQVKW